MARRFAAGDRVRTIRPIADLPAGARGPIHLAFPFDDVYAVRFDRQPEPRVVQDRDLAPGSTGAEPGTT